MSEEADMGRGDVAVADGGEGDVGPVDAVRNAAEAVLVAFDQIHEGADDDDDIEQGEEEDDDLAAAGFECLHQVLSLAEVLRGRCAKPAGCG